MAAMTFIRKIAAGETLQIFNNGDMRRDFTYIDDILNGTLNCLERPPIDDGGKPPAEIYNLGNNRGEDLMKFVRIIEREMGIEVKIEYLPLQPGDVLETLADIEKSGAELDYEPKVSIEEGLSRLVEWYMTFYGLR
jgi:UDP-glucuronate 4-epimerase